MDGATRPKFISVSVGPIMSGRSMRELLTRHIASLIVRCRRLSWRQCCGSIQTCWTRLSSASRMTSPATYHEHWSYHAPLTYDCTTYCSSSTVRNIDLSSSIGVGCGGEVFDQWWRDERATITRTVVPRTDRSDLSDLRQLTRTSHERCWTRNRHRLPHEDPRRHVRHASRTRFPEVMPVASWTTRRHSRDDVGEVVGVVECGL